MSSVQDEPKNGENASEIKETGTKSGLSVDELKNQGNNAYKEGNFSLACDYFSQAIQSQEELFKNASLPDSPESKDPSFLLNTKTLLSTLYLNRSLTNAALKDWINSAIDAQKATYLNSKYTKAHFRLVRAFIELGHLREARQSLSFGFKECGDNKDFRSVEEELFKLTGIPVRPKPNDFEVVSELGAGNYTTVYKAELKATKAIYAIKTIEKVTVDKTAKRHPNIHNEILMEKRVLNKLEHPGIVSLYGTFQDAGTLYYLMEYLGGSDLWTHLHEIIEEQKKVVQRFNEDENPKDDDDDENFDEDGHGRPKTQKKVTSQIGLHWSQIQYYFSEILSVVEYLHRY
jgi:tetratricopeptide (TPR) repeat protein